MLDIAGRKFIAYYRMDDVPLSDQVLCVQEHTRRQGGQVVRGYRDQEPEARSDRPGLKKAIAAAKRHGASLIVATLDKLGRDVRFLRTLERSGLDFVACDLPEANSRTIHVLRALAEYEQRRTEAAAHTRGRNLDPAARARGARRAGEVLRSQADAAYRELAPLVAELRAAGFTLREIASRLNAAGYRTRRGQEWNPMQVSRVLKRSGRASGSDA
jgi:DNA invertase Pin-like site-specific DNA recombinase